MSLVNRLSGFFLLALVLVLGGFSVTLYLLWSTHFQADLDERLGLALDALTPAVEVDPGRIQWKPLSTPPEEIHATGERTRWAVFDRSGRVVESSWELAPEDLEGIFRQAPDSGHIHSSFIDHEGGRWRLAIRRVTTPPASMGRDREKDEAFDERLALRDKAASPVSMVLATGLSLESTEAGLRNVGITLVGISAGIWVLAATVGRRLCRRALLPVTRMARVACTMGAADRDQRLPSPGTDDELDALASSFNGLLDRLHQALERQKRFTGDASHQLRTPLAGLLGQIEVTRRRDRSTSEYRLALDQIHAEALRLGQIVESLLFMARAENEAITPELLPLRLDAWLPNHLTRWSTHSRIADIHHDVPAETPLLARVHPPLLAQLVDNLLDNACKYSVPGTPIDAHLDHEHGTVILTVEDRGFGIAAEDLALIFDPFFRSTDARRRGQPGVGLGLSVVRRIAEVFHGHIQAESRPGQGSRFILRLPEALPAKEFGEREVAFAPCASPLE